MPARPTPSVVVFVADVERLTRFYQSVAEMRVVVADDRHAVLEIDGFQLVVHALPPQESPQRTPLVVREDTYVKVCLPVDSIAAARERAQQLGGRIRPSSDEWEARGFRACDGHDPEGNVIQVRETLT